MQKRWLAILAGILILGFVTARAEAQMKIGVVDLEKVFEQSEEGKKAQAALQKKVERIELELKSKQDELKTMEEQISTQGSLLSESAKFDKEKSYQDKLKDFKRLYEDYQSEMRQEQSKMNKTILDQFLGIIKAMGEREGYDLILEDNAVLHSSKKIDVTDQVIKSVNEKKKP